ncbi:DJ-1/PfpI family protein [Variovorax sp. 770b2]|uniref:DJ-1/PfpI family protein n=1 Tax=Variovorax sp. 770b2 TaxID=1566271 RepID=UPI0008E620B9|nr:DJ-1/PfpI family protein [Variovorax sp. 770b2]SFQ33214.1 DJ-1/PfpI family protein [Variovorax sp. 770b2]
MTIERRSFFRTAAAALAASPWLASAAEDKATPVPPTHDMSAMPAYWTGKEQIGMLLYPGFTALDFVGPQHMFAGLMGATVHHVAKTMAPVTSDTHLSISPTTTLAQCPAELDVLFVPGGGEGTLAALRDKALLRFVAQRGARAKWVTSVCTGSLILGAAGLLKGYKATSHWAVHPLLADVGAMPVEARVVRDRNRITGAGVSAGLDLGLRIVAMLRDQPYAEMTQLLAEYAPEPPFNAGTPRTAAPAVKAMVDDMFKDFLVQTRSALSTAPTLK